MTNTSFVTDIIRINQKSTLKILIWYDIGIADIANVSQIFQYTDPPLINTAAGEPWHKVKVKFK